MQVRPLVALSVVGGCLVLLVVLTCVREPAADLVDVLSCAVSSGPNGDSRSEAFVPELTQAPPARAQIDRSAAEAASVGRVNLPRLRVVSQLGPPVAAARVEVGIPVLGVHMRGSTDAAGVWKPEVASALEGDRDRLKLVISAAADGHANGLWTFDVTASSAVEDLALTLALAGALEILVVDETGAPAADAVVLLNYYGSRERPSADSTFWPVGVQPHYRVETDDWGRASILTLQEGWWEIKTVEWRDWEGTEPKTVWIGAQQQANAQLEVVRWDAKTYSSGWLSLPDGTAAEDVYLRRKDAPHVTLGVYSDGAFYVRMGDAGPVTWEVLARDGRLGPAFDVYRGRHGERIVVRFPE